MGVKEKLEAGSFLLHVLKPDILPLSSSHSVPLRPHLFSCHNNLPCKTVCPNHWVIVRAESTYTTTTTTVNHLTQGDPLRSGVYMLVKNAVVHGCLLSLWRNRNGGKQEHGICTCQYAEAEAYDNHPMNLAIV